MAHQYKVGETVVLKDGPVRMAKSAGPCKILAALPESQGSRQYRIRFESENFDRMVSEDDIDASSSPMVGGAKSGNSSNSSKEKDPWLKANSVRTGK